MTEEQRSKIDSEVIHFCNQIDNESGGKQKFVGFAFSSAIRNTDGENLKEAADYVMACVMKRCHDRITHHDNMKNAAIEGASSDKNNFEMACKEYDRAVKSILHYGRIHLTAEVSWSFIKNGK